MTLKVPGEKMFYTTDFFTYIYFNNSEIPLQWGLGRI